MPNKRSYLQACFMKPELAMAVNKMIGLHEEFSDVHMSIDSDVKKEGEVLVILEIPEAGVDMPRFYGEFCKAMNSEHFYSQSKESK